MANQWVLPHRASHAVQGLMWRAINTDGTLTYSFIESVQAMHPYHIVRFLGGFLYLLGMLIMAYNVLRTILGAPSPVAVAKVAESVS